MERKFLCVITPDASGTKVTYPFTLKLPGWELDVDTFKQYPGESILSRNHTYYKEAIVKGISC